MDRVGERLIELSDILDEFQSGHNAKEISENLLLFSFLTECYKQKGFVYSHEPSKEKHPAFSLFFHNMKEFFYSYQLTATEQESFFSRLHSIIQKKPNIRYGLNF